MASPIGPSLPRSSHVEFADDAALESFGVRGVLPLAVSGRLLGVHDGVVHSVRLGAGRVLSYRSDTIRSATESDSTAGNSTASDIFVFGGSIFAFGRGSLAQALSPGIDTARPVDLAGRSQVLSACPKHDPVTGDLHLLAVALDGSQAHVVVSSGALTRRSRPILDAPNEVSDLAIMGDHIVLVCDGFVGVTTRDAEARTNWIATGVGAPVAVQAHDRAEGVIVHVVTPSLERWTLNGGASSVDRHVLDPTPRRFARTSDSLLDKPPRFLWTTGDRAADTYDLATGRRVRHSFGARQPGDLVFAADPTRPGEADGGWLVGFVPGSDGEDAELVVLDAADISRPAAAAVRVAPRIPPELHTTWIPTSNQ